MDVFNPPRKATLGSVQAYKEAAHEAKFGDGYEQVVPIGVNAFSEMWQLVFDGCLQSDADYIVDFVRAHVGKTFLYSAPNGGQKMWRFVPKSVRVSFKGGLRMVVTASIDEVFR